METTIPLSTTQETLLDKKDTIVFPKRNPTQLALKDLKEGTQKWRVWLMIAYQDLKLRYRRSVLGPFWITISMAITVYSMGFLYSHLFHTDLASYFPFLVGGMLAWSLISSSITDLTEAFVVSDGLIKQVKLPYSLYIHRIAARNVLIFFHNLVVIIPILIIFHHEAKINFYTLLLIPNLFLIYINIISYGMILAMVGARYRDVAQIIRSLTQVVFFMTPVMWNPSILPAGDQYLVKLNPFYAFVELIRAPLIGSLPSLQVFLMLSLVTIIGVKIAFGMFKKYRTRIVYWV